MTPTPYVYSAIVTKVQDGDSITVEVKLGFGALFEKLKLRMHGLDCPETKTPAGKEVKAYVTEQLLNKLVIINTYKDTKEKYGRYLVDIYLDGKNFNQHLINSGRAQPWDGQGAHPEQPV